MKRFQSEAIAAELADAVGYEHVSSEAGELLIYTGDWSWMSQMWLDRGERPPLPDFVVHPGSAQEVAAVLRVAATYKLPVVPWGGGSGTQGGAAPLFGGIVLDTKRLNRILEIDERSLLVRAQTGIIGTTLEWALNERGLTLPHYPASANAATLGGYLAARGSGVISTKYGKAEDLVLMLEMVLPDATIARTLPVPSHAAGPGLLQLFVGSEGTLGVITEATMRLERLPEARLLSGMLFGDLQAALEAGRRIMTRAAAAMRAAPVRRSVDHRCAQARAGSGRRRRVLYSRLRRAARDRRSAGAPRARDLRELGGEYLGREPGEHWWNHRYDFYYPPLALALPKLYGTTDTVCTFDKIERLYEAKKRVIEEDFAEWNARYIAHFSHWFPWGVMVYDRFIVDEPPADPREALRLHNRIWTAAARTSLEHGGVLNEHHGIGWKLGRLMREQYGAAWPVLERIKAGGRSARNYESRQAGVWGRDQRIGGQGSGKSSAAETVVWGVPHQIKPSAARTGGVGVSLTLPNMDQILLTTEGCRYCLMCRHVCPVTRVTFSEATSPHGWALTIASLRRGLLEWDPQTVDLLYRCADCGLCQAHCVTDQPLPQALVAARAEAVSLGHAPAPLREIETALREWGNPWREAPRTSEVEAAGDVLFVGATAWHFEPAERRSCPARCYMAAMCLTRRSASGGRAATWRIPSACTTSLARLPRRRCEDVRRSQCRRLLTLSVEQAWTFRVLSTRCWACRCPRRSRLWNYRCCWRPGWTMVRCGCAAAAQKLAYHDACHTPRLAERWHAPRRLLTALGQPPREGFWRERRATSCGASGGLPFTQPRLADPWRVQRWPICPQRRAGGHRRARLPRAPARQRGGVGGTWVVRRCWRNTWSRMSDER